MPSFYRMKERLFGGKHPTRADPAPGITRHAASPIASGPSTGQPSSLSLPLPTSSSPRASPPSEAAQNLAVSHDPPFSPRPHAPSGVATISASDVNKTFEKAIAIAVERLPAIQVAAFTHASKNIDEHTLLSDVRAYDATHKDNSSFRPHAERLSKFLGFLNQGMGGIAIGIQASPEISSLVVGAARIVIDLALKYAMFFTRLAGMISTLQDLLLPLGEYAKTADIEHVGNTVASAYANMLEFGWKARRVFVDDNGNQRKWASLRAFIRQYWETFESEFVSIKEDLQHDLYVLQHSITAMSFDAVRKMGRSQILDRKRKERSSFLAWVSDIDFETVHQNIYAKKHDNTGDWLVMEPKYQQWLDSPASSLLWCHGKPGIGKSVLASSIIEDITANKVLQENAHICFAYYSYRDTRLKDLHQLLASFVKQLCRRRDCIPTNLLQIKDDAFPQSTIGTQDHLVSLVSSLPEVYLVFDALDECPEQEREEVLGFITSILTLESTSCRVKVFATSRPETDISDAFEKHNVPTIKILAENVKSDIETYTRSQVEILRKGKNGKTLHITDDSLKDNIVQSITAKADGMFLWVNLQLDHLCQASKAKKDHVVERELQSLPKGLSETYIRILQQIENQSGYMRNLALNCLAWTIHARRPLEIEELQYALASSMKSKDEEDIELCLPDVDVILGACGNLLEKVNGAIRPIHYTVQEFLIDATQQSPEGTIQAQLLDLNSMHTKLSLACLDYIHATSFKSPEDRWYDLDQRLELYPFTIYAYQNFDYHVSRFSPTSGDVMASLERLLLQDGRYLAAVLQIKVLRDGLGYFDVEDHFNDMQFPVTAATIVFSTSLFDVSALRQQWTNDSIPQYALHLAASSGLVSAIRRLLEAGCDINERDAEQSTPLYHACFNTNLDTVKILLNAGAEINAQGGRLGNGLQAASYKGHEPTVKLLLESEANINAQGGQYGYALHAASYSGHEPVVKLLLNLGADVNAQGGIYGSALEAASYKRNEQIVKLLLGTGADVNAQGGEYGTALQAAASYPGHKQIVMLLLEAGADVNAQGEGEYGPALQAASFNNERLTVKLLLKSGADVDAQGGEHGTALQVASLRGSKQIVKLLLDAGADVNAQGGDFRTALQAASFSGKKQIVKLLLEAGSDVNAQGGRFGTALQAAASCSGHKQTIKLLLEAGADVNVQGGIYGSALQAASFDGHEQIVKLLLKAGADVNAQGGEYGTALQVASFNGKKQAVKLLLEAGADVNAQGGAYGTALQAASFEGHEQIVKILLEAGAGVNAQGGIYGTALQAASFRGSKQIVKLLLEAGADVNAHDREHGTALQVASSKDYEEWTGEKTRSFMAEDREQVVKLLLEAGADVNARGGKYGSALRAALSEDDYEWKNDEYRVAASECYERTVKLLREAGAVEDPELLDETAR